MVTGGVRSVTFWRLGFRKPSALPSRLYFLHLDLSCYRTWTLHTCGVHDRMARGNNIADPTFSLFPCVHTLEDKTCLLLWLGICVACPAFRHCSLPKQRNQTSLFFLSVDMLQASLTSALKRRRSAALSIEGAFESLSSLEERTYLVSTYINHPGMYFSASVCIYLKTGKGKHQCRVETPPK